jgi:membrane protein DedA with SNARE-associated domain
LTFATIGSITGFMLMFYIGSTVDKKVIQAGRFRYIPVNTIEKVEMWFRKYGYFV